MSAKEKFLEWYETERQRGLVDFKLTTNDLSETVSEEDFYAELNEMNALIEERRFVERLDVF